MIDRATKLSARTPPTVVALLIIAATFGLMLLMGAAPAEVATVPMEGASIEIEAPSTE